MNFVYRFIAIASLVVYSITSFAQGNFYVLNNTIVTTTPNNCSPTQVDVRTYLGCRNFVNNGSTFSISNDTINIEVKYTSSFICQGALSQPVFNVNLDTLPSGNYIIASTAILDVTSINTVYTPLSVASCCSPTSNLEALFTLSDSIFCEGERIQLTNQSINGLSFNWFVNNVLTSSLTQPFLDSLPAGSYAVRLEADSASCSDDTTINFTVAPSPVVDLGPDTTICQGSSITLIANSMNAVSYFWQDSTTADTLNTNLAGIYHVTITESMGCTSVDSVIVSVSVCTGINNSEKIENAITAFPNPMNGAQSIWISAKHNSTKMYDYALYNTVGKKVKSGRLNLSNNAEELTISGFDKGIFFLQILDENELISTLKLVIN